MNQRKISENRFDRICRISFRFFGKAADKIRIPELNRNLKKSRMYISESIYLSLLIFSIFCITVALLFAEIFVFALRKSKIIETEPTSVAIGICFAAFVLIAVLITLFLLIPYLKAYDKKIKIEQQLPFATNYMAAMAAAGVRTEIIFQSFSKETGKMTEKVYDELSAEIKTIEIQTNYFGKNYPSALLILSEETASPLFSDFINGVRNTFISGGSFQKYIISKKHEYQSLAAGRKEKYFQTLEMLSEIYIIIFLSMPIFFMILFYTMMPLSGPETEKMNLLTYQIVPFLGILFLLILEIINEKENV